MTATYYLPDKMGDHDFKAGIEYANDQSRNGNNGNSGPIRYRDRNGLIDEIRVADFNTFEASARTGRARTIATCAGRRSSRIAGGRRAE